MLDLAPPRSGVWTTLPTEHVQSSAGRWITKTGNTADAKRNKLNDIDSICQPRNRQILTYEYLFRCNSNWILSACLAYLFHQEYILPVGDVRYEEATR